MLKPKQVRQQRQKKKHTHIHVLSTLLLFFSFSFIMFYDTTCYVIPIQLRNRPALSLLFFFRLETHILGCEVKSLACSSVICKQSRRQRTQNHVATTSNGYLRLFCSLFILLLDQLVASNVLWGVKRTTSHRVRTTRRGKKKKEIDK